MPITTVDVILTMDNKAVVIQIGDLQEQARLVKAVIIKAGLLLMFQITEEAARLINKVQVLAIVEALKKATLVNIHGSQSLTLCWSMERRYLLLK